MKNVDPFPPPLLLIWGFLKTGKVKGGGTHYDIVYLTYT